MYYPDQQSIMRTAVHEAAHGYMCYCNCFPVESVSVKRYTTDQKLGEVIAAFPLTTAGLAWAYRSTPIMATIEVVQTLAVYYVGAMAADEACGGNDLTDVARWGEAWRSLPASLGAPAWATIAAEARAFTRAWLAKPRVEAAIVALADRLSYTFFAGEQTWERLCAPHGKVGLITRAVPGSTAARVPLPARSTPVAKPPPARVPAPVTSKPKPSPTSTPPRRPAVLGPVSVWDDWGFDNVPREQQRKKAAQEKARQEAAVGYVPPVPRDWRTGGLFPFHRPLGLIA